MGPLKLSNKQLKPDPRYVDFVQTQGIQMRTLLLPSVSKQNPFSLFRRGLDLISPFVTLARDIGTLS